MKNTLMPNLEQLHELYHHFKPDTIPTELQKVKQYLANGHSWYSKNISKDKQGEHEDNLDTLKEIKTLMEDMLVMSGSYLALYHEHTDSKVNVSPFLYYVQNNKMRIVISRIRDVQVHMQEYLNDSNICEFKSCIKIMDELEFLFSWIFRD